MIAGYRFRCDGCRRAWIVSPDALDPVTVAGARDWAAQHDWSSSGERDICPRCRRDGVVAALLLQQHHADAPGDLT